MTKISSGVLLLATALLAAVYLLFMPVRTDGGWYSYPGYALSQGRDPSENLLPPQTLRDTTEGIRGTFGWESRTSLLVLGHAAWFELFGSGAASIRALELTQWLLLTALVFVATHTLTRSKAVALVMAMLALSDSWVMSESLSDLRPDVAVACLALVCLTAMLIYSRSRGWLSLSVSLLAALTLLLTHATAVAAFAACTLFACTHIVLTRYRRERAAWALLGVVGAGIVVFLLRMRIFDVLIPTSVAKEIEDTGRHAFLQKIVNSYSDGIWGKLVVELERWFDYLFVSNAIHGLVLLVGVAAAAWHSRRVSDIRSVENVSVVGAFVTATATIAILDPHFTASHLLSVVCIGYVAAAGGIHLLLARISSAQLSVAVAAVLVGVAGLRVAHAANLYLAQSRSGVSIAAIESLMERSVNGEQDQMMIAPASLWLYVPANASVVLVDVRNRPWQASAPEWREISTLVVDRDFLDQGWRSTVEQLQGCGALAPIAEVGRPESGYYLIAFHVLKPGCVAGIPESA